MSGKQIEWEVRHVKPEPQSLVVTIRVVSGEPEIGDEVVGADTGVEFSVTGFAAVGYGATNYAAGIRILAIRPKENCDKLSKEVPLEAGSRLLSKP